MAGISPLFRNPGPGGAVISKEELSSVAYLLVYDIPSPSWKETRGYSKRMINHWVNVRYWWNALLREISQSAPGMATAEAKRAGKPLPFGHIHPFTESVWKVDVEAKEFIEEYVDELLRRYEDNGKNEGVAMWLKEGLIDSAQAVDIRRATQVYLIPHVTTKEGEKMVRDIEASSIRKWLEEQLKVIRKWDKAPPSEESVKDAVKRLRNIKDSITYRYGKKAEMPNAETYDELMMQVNVVGEALLKYAPMLKSGGATATPPKT